MTTGTTEGPKAPAKAMWICLILAWVFLLLPIPFTVFIAAPLNVAAIILAIVCLVRAKVPQGVLGLIGASIGSTIMYLIGWALFAVNMAEQMAK